MTLALRCVPVLVVCSLVLGCGDDSPKPDEVSGDWSALSGPVAEHLTLAPDGNFSARACPGGIFFDDAVRGPTALISGDWTLDGQNLVFRIGEANSDSLAGQTVSARLEKVGDESLVLVDRAGRRQELQREGSFGPNNGYGFHFGK